MRTGAARLSDIASRAAGAARQLDAVGAGGHAFSIGVVLLGSGAALAIWTWLPLVLAASEQPQRGIALVLLAATLVLMGAIVLACAARTGAARRAPESHAPAARSASAGAARVAFLGGYLALLAWFRYFDVWAAHFAEGGLHYAVYNLARAAFVFYLGIVLIETGRLATRQFPAAQEEPAARAGLLEAFYSGAAIWILGGFVLGVAHGIYWAPLAAATAVLVWRGYPVAQQVLQTARSAVSAFNATSLSGLAWTCALACSLGLVVVLVGVNLGFAVSGFEYDASGHYLPYYAQVATNHSTAPNEYWYHFWVSKGAFLHFLAVVLTDIQGPQLVSFLLLLAALGVAYGLIRDATGDRRWGIAAAAVLAAPFISHFHFFQKHHIVTLSLIAGLLWLSRPGLSGAAPRAPMRQALAVALMGAALVCNTPPIAAVVVPYVFCFGIWLRRRGLPVSGAFLPFFASSFAIAGILCLNQAWTGLAEVTPFKIFLSFANQQALSEYVSPYLLLLAEEGSSNTTGRLSLDALASGNLIGGRLHSLLRTQGLMPQLAAVLPLLVLAVVAALAASRRFRMRFASHLGPASLLAAVAVAFGFFVNQPGSIERFYTFAYYPLVIMVTGSAGLLCHEARALWAAGAACGFMQLIAFVLTVGLAAGAASYWISHYLWLDGPAYLQERTAFIAGQRSFKDALTYVHRRRNEGGWPRRDLSNECLSIRRFLGHERGAADSPPAPKVWTLTFLQESGCHILPGVQMQMEFSVRFGPRWHRIVFGTPENALAELGRLGVSRFYVSLREFDIDRPERISTSIFGCLAYSPLFQPDSLKSRFRIAWQDGGAVLLALRGESEVGGSEITAGFLDAWRRKTSPRQHGLGDMGAICGRLAHYYRTQAESWPVSRDPSLPPIKGWQ